MGEIKQLFKLQRLTEAHSPEVQRALGGERVAKYLCLNAITVNVRITSGSMLEVIKLPSGLALIRMGEFVAVVDAETLLASFERV